MNIIALVFVSPKRRLPYVLSRFVKIFNGFNSSLCSLAVAQKNPSFKVKTKSLWQGTIHTLPTFFLIQFTTMSYAASTSSYTLSPMSTSSPHAFNIFTTYQSPRESYILYEEFGQIFRPVIGRTGGRKRCNSSPTMKGGFKKWFGMDKGLSAKNRSNTL